MRALSDILRDADSASAFASGGGGTSTFGSATLNIPQGRGVQDYEEEIAVPTATAVKKVRCWFAVATAEDENGPDWLGGVYLYAIPSAGLVTFGIMSTELQSGPIKIEYEVI